LLERFEQEARAAGQLNHPNILVIYDVGLADGTPYMVTELLEGETLRERLDTGPFAPREVVEIAEQVAAGLAAAHARGIVHRDLKPENLFLLNDGHVKILDFGIAKLLDHTADETRTVERMLTPVGRHVAVQYRGWRDRSPVARFPRTKCSGKDARNRRTPVRQT
jgi:serine/threonine protein kinase